MDSEWIWRKYTNTEIKKAFWNFFQKALAEREGFEPPVPLGTTVFKTVVIDHSTISPEGVICSQPASLLKASAKLWIIIETAKYLKEKNPNIKVLGVDAFGSVLKKYHETKEFDNAEIYPYRIEGLGKNLIPTATDFDIIDKFIKVSDEESAHTTRELAKKEGLFVGYTSGAAFQAVKQYAEEGEFDANSKVVIIFPDHGSRYMSKVFSDDWMNEQGFFDSVNQEEALKIEIIK